jgi:hypothetical protein
MQKIGIADVQAQHLISGGFFDIKTKEWSLEKTDASGLDIILDHAKIAGCQVACEHLVGKGVTLCRGQGKLFCRSCTAETLSPIDNLTLDGNFTPLTIGAMISGKVANSPFTGTISGDLYDIQIKGQLQGKLQDIVKRLNKKEAKDAFVSSYNLQILPREAKYKALMQVDLKEDGSDLTIHIENRFFSSFDEAIYSVEFHHLPMSYVDCFVPTYAIKGHIDGSFEHQKEQTKLHAKSYDWHYESNRVHFSLPEKQCWEIVYKDDPFSQNYKLDLFAPLLLCEDKDLGQIYELTKAEITSEDKQLFFTAKELSSDQIKASLKGWYDFKTAKCQVNLHEASIGIAKALPFLPENQHVMPKGSFQGEVGISWSEIDHFHIKALGVLSGLLIKTENGDLSDVQAEIDIDTARKKGAVSAFQATMMQKGQPFYLSIPYGFFEKTKGWIDVRVGSEMNDFVRAAIDLSITDRIIAEIDPKKSYIFDQNIKKGRFTLSTKGNLLSYHLRCDLSLGPLAAFTKKFIHPNRSIVAEGFLDCDFSNEKIIIQGRDLAIETQKIAQIDFTLQREKEIWKTEKGQIDDLMISFEAVKKDPFWHLKKVGLTHPEFSARMDLKCKSYTDLYASVDQFTYDLKRTKFCGLLQGKGYLSFNLGDEPNISVDLDIEPPTIQLGEFFWTNRTPVHVQYQNTKTVMVTGIDCDQMEYQKERLPFHLKVGSLLFSFFEKEWFFSKAQGIFSSELVKKCSKIMENKGSNSELLKWASQLPVTSDFEISFNGSVSTDGEIGSCESSEIIIPFKGEIVNLKTARCQWQSSHLSISLIGFFRNLPCLIDANIERGKRGKGWIRFADNMEKKDPLEGFINWNEQLFSLEKLSGQFHGLSFDFFPSADDRGMLGSLGIDFQTCYPLMPQQVKNAIETLGLGKGYWLKGIWNYQTDGGLSFKGLFTGKNCLFLGFQFQSLFSQLHFTNKECKWFDLKLSDQSGIAICDYILLKEKEDKWHLSIPMLAVHEFRPSLLKEEGQEVGKLEPFLIRELQLHKFQGEIGNPESFTGEGSFHFINSFKREHTILDLPSDFLGRIFGLDLELLIPVRGDVQFSIASEMIQLKTLSESFSENRRSEFFLDDRSLPYIDFSGDLHVHIRMKHYVLFTFTENFVISIGGKLLDPIFNLRRKKSIF